jgi:ABC-type iron transport system FetAB ATPase subunit
MTALEILKALKADRANAILWINHDRRQAAFHPGRSIPVCQPVDYSEAMMARTDPALSVINQTDGEILSA